eukprot:3196357-Ditylum_brightwellii.AAC.1
MCDWLSGNFAWGSVCCRTESAGGTGPRRIVVIDHAVGIRGTGPRRIVVLDRIVDIRGTGPQGIVVLDRVMGEIGPWQNRLMKRLLMPRLYVPIAGEDNG